MMDQLFDELRRRRIRIWADGERLKYDAPNGALTEELVELLRLHKGALLDHLADAVPSSTVIPCVARGRDLAPSFAQERMWLLWKLTPSSAAYNVPFVIKVRGRFDSAAMIEALGSIRARHEVLRSRFRRTPDGVRLVVEDARLEIPLVVLEGDLPRNEELAERHIQEAAGEAFDLESAPPFAAAIYRLDETVHWIFIQLHHVVADAWSLPIFVRELAGGYRAFERGDHERAPAPRVQYADFAAWQRHRISGRRRARLLSYWQRVLDRGPAPLRLPFARPEAHVRSMRAGRVSFELSPALSARLSELGRDHDATPFMVLASAFRILLYRYSDQSDFLIGTPTVCRNHQDLESLIGYFGNTLVLRNPLNRLDRCLDVLRRERDAALGAYDHQELPFEVLVGELAPRRARDQSALFNVMFSHSEGQAPFFLSPRVDAELCAVETSTAKFDLMLATHAPGEGAIAARSGSSARTTAPGEGVSGTIEYADELFERASIERMVGHLKSVLEGIVRSPSARVGELALVGEFERRVVLHEWNDTGAATSEQPLHERFEAQAASRPNAIAIFRDGETTTYEELDGESNRIANALLRLGVLREQPIGVYLTRSPRLVAALLGVLKAGAAYVPIDPLHPASRVRAILADSGCRVVLTERPLVGSLSGFDGTLVSVDDAKVADASRSRPGVSVGAGDLAYVLYTSGSTGAPKGVMIEHRNAAALVDWAHAHYSSSELACVFAATSVSFDLSVFELFVPLCAGQSVVLADDALALPALPARERITLINTVPSVMRALLRAHARPLPDSVEVVNLAGEPLDESLVDEIYRRSHAKKVYDLYGPTEATTYATCKLRLPNQPASIGRPIANTRCYVLDSDGQPVPIGLMGELYLAGSGVSRGYLNQPELTAERFVAPRAHDIREERVYRTGDRVRYTTNGELEFHGRIDSQLKIRGHRIEPEEVRAALLHAPGVNEAWIGARKTRDGDVQLAAFVVGDPDACSPRRLKLHLENHLPRYMIPSSFVRLDELPLTRHGKVDAARLEAIEPPDDGPKAAPLESETERRIAAIWEEVLGARNLGTDSDFFELGGHSLTAMRVTARLNEALGIDLSLKTIFQYPTIGELGAVSDNALSTRAPALPPLTARERHRAVATLVQRHLWLVHNAVGDPSFLNIATGIDIHGPLELEALIRALATLGTRHPILKARLTKTDRELWLEANTDQELAPVVYDFSDAGDVAARQRSLAAMHDDARRPFDLAEGPCCRLRIARLGIEHHHVMIVLHHVIGDEWSLRELKHDLAMAYADEVHGRPATCPQPALTFFDYAAWERECLVRRCFDEPIARWCERLQPPLPRLSLPWRDRAPERLASFPVAIDGAVGERLLKVARTERCSLFVVLLSALKRLLKHTTGVADIRVSTNLAARHLRGVENMVGPLTDTVVLRTVLAEPDTAVDALRRVRSTILAAYANQGAPFDAIAARLKSDLGVRREDLAQVFFMFHEDAPAPSLVGIDATNTAIDGPSDFFQSALHGHDVILYLHGSSAGIRGQLTLRGDLDEGRVAIGLSSRYRALLEELVHDADVE